MTGTDTSPGVWRIGIRGRVDPGTASLLAELALVVADATTELETELTDPDTCASTLAKLQALGLDVVDVHWVPVSPVGE
jgi:hypothetical protein